MTRAHRTGGLIGVFIAAVVLAGFLAPGGAQEGGPTTIWSGVFSVSQAERGGALYAERCQACHVLEGAPVAPVLVGGLFLENWSDATLGDLYEVIDTTMPVGAPGSLSPAQIAEVMAFILATSGAPAGQTDLDASPAALGRVTIRTAP